MPSYAFGAYSVSVGERMAAVTDRLVLGDIDGNGRDLIDCFEAELAAVQTEPWTNEDERIAVRVTDLTRNDRVLSGVLQTGGYGFEDEIFDVELDEVTKKLAPTEAAMRDYHFRLELPIGAREGLLLSQRTSGHGVRQMFWEQVRRRIQEKIGDYTIHVNGFHPEAVWRKFLEDGELGTVTLYRHSIPQDYAEYVGGGIGVEVDGTMETRLRPPKKKFFARSWLGQWLEGAKPLDAGIEIDNTHYDGIKVTMSVGSRDRTIDLRARDRGHPLYDVTDEVGGSAATPPTMGVLATAADQLAGDLAQHLGWG